MDEQEDTQLSELGLNDFRPMPRNLFVGGAEQDQLSGTDDDERTPTGYATQPEHFQIPTETRQRHPRQGSLQHERLERSIEPARATELEERTRVLEMAIGKILACLILDDPLIPLLNRDAQPAAVVATCNSPALSNVVVPTRPRGSGRLNPEPSSSKHNEELLKKNADLERQLKDVQKSIDELKSPKSHQQTLDLDSAPLNLSITAEPYQEGFKIPHLETYDGSGDPDEHLHTYQAIMRIQNANDAMMCKVFPATLKSTAKRWYHKLPRHSIDSYSQLAKLFSNKIVSPREIKRTATELMQVHQKEGESLRDYMQRFNKATLDIDNVPDTIYLSALLHGLKPGRFLDDLLENPPKSWNEVNDRSASFILSEDFQSFKRRVDDRQGKEPKQPEGRDDKKKQKGAKAPRAVRHMPGSSVDYKRVEGEPDIMMPHADPFVATVHIGNHNINKVFIDTGSSPDILYWSCFQKMQLNPSSLQKHERPIYGFDNQPVPVEGVITLPIYVGIEPCFRIAFVSFLAVKMESAFNAILGRATLCKLKAVISQPHICMKFPTPQGVGVLKGNQKMAKACYQDTFKKVKLAATPRGSSGSHRPTQPDQQTMSISNIEHRPEGVEHKAEPVELVETIPLNPDIPERTSTSSARTPPKCHGLKKRRLFGLEKQAAIDEEIQKLLQAGFIKRVEYSEWVSNPVLVKKPNGKWRMCTDFTNLNEASGYHQVQLLLDDQEKTTFYAGDVIYCYVMMPFGLKNAGATYQKLVQVVFKLQIGKNIEIYVDDMIVTSKRAEDHIADLNETFRNLRRAQMKLNPLKCTFAVESGKFLGYVVSKKGIEVNPEKVQAVQQMEPPKTIKDVQCLTGRIAALHRFIAKSTERCLPFFKALREPKNFQWTTECQQAFDELKQYLALAPLLSKPVEGESLYLYLGVTEEAVSSILLREKNKHQKPICYVSKILQGAEQNYPLAEKAAFALVYTAPAHNHKRLGCGGLPSGVPFGDGGRKGTSISGLGPVQYEALIYGLKLASELKAQSIKVFSDSQLVVGQVNGSCEIRDPQLGHYASVVNILKSGFVSFQIDKIPRVDNQRADELSKLASSQDINPQRSTIVEILDAPSYTDFTIEAANFTLLDNQLYKRAASMPLLRCLTPYKAEYAVREVHEGVCGTHIGGRTLARKLMRHGYYWPTMVEDAQSYAKKCPTYQFNADDIHMPVDLLGPFTKGKGGCTYLVVAVDYFTKWIEAKPLSTTTEKKIKEFLFNSILCRFGIPERIIADNGPQFRAAALRSLCDGYGIELALTSVYTPQSNGQAESANKIILRGLKTRVLAAHSNWVNELNRVLWSCHTTPSSATGETPFSLAYGAEAVIPIERSDCHLIE
ncbi:hypothetical protein SLEP1_g41093 [Rubroshorea leprosula]|uniref:Integrase catalytic domain-containing protein n=1 Tax=Rubroshorea leprosula TaxID=152421 RepID=A0AAV5L5W3_9ROSI|nr:hypothetical protein SLEP1_g41093 [Rubroshorea leprosula]